MMFKRKFRSRPWKKSRRGKFSRRVGRRTFQSRVRKVIMKTAETKYYDIGVQDNQLYHNLGHGVGLVPPTGVESLPALFNPWALIEKGTDRMDRIGDKITPRGMSLKMFLANKADRVNTCIRIIVAILPKTTDGGAITTYAYNPFQIANYGVMNNNILLPADKDKGVKFLYDKVHRMAPQQFNHFNEGKEYTKVIKLWIRRKRSRDIVFSTYTQNIVNKPLAVYAIPYEQFGTLQTANVASVTSLMRLYYKDI